MLGDPDKMAAQVLGLGDAGPKGAAPGDGPPGATDADADADEGLKMAGEDLMSAIHAKDSAGVVSALRAAFELLQAAPPQEAAGTEE